MLFYVLSFAFVVWGGVALAFAYRFKSIYLRTSRVDLATAPGWFWFGVGFHVFLIVLGVTLAIWRISN
ncbi:MAG TPA: hypothetical protein VKT26_02100 [Acetobacteraceae bacterium]|nr:hypothetical protein [Acetobacteraceae bacterium]